MRKKPILQRSTLAMALSAAVALSGCALGPDFKQPQAPAAAGNSYTATALPASTASVAGVNGGAAQQFVAGQELPAMWWQLFGSPALDELVRAALAQNPSMAAAEASLRQAQEAYKAQAGSLNYPSVNGQLGVAREKQPASAGNGGGVFTLYNASVAVAYTPDVFGASRRTLEGAQAQVDYQRFQVEATYLALSANVVTTAIRSASLRAQLQATQEVQQALAKQLAVIEKQFELGAIPRTTLLSQRNQLAQVSASVPPLEKALAQSRHQLAVLAGRLPGEGGLPDFTLESLTLPQQLPVSLPSALVRQRPDIRASEELLHAASAAIGVATAAQYPQLTLSGSYGSSAQNFGKLFDAETTAWSLASNLTAPIFNGGALSAKKRAAEAAYDGAAAQYRATVLSAFQDVADSLRALESDAAALKAQAEADALAAEALALATSQYKLGGISYLALLDAQRSYQQAHVALVQAQAARYADTAALFQALGGGWWNRNGGAATASAVSAAPVYGSSAGAAGSSR